MDTSSTLLTNSVLLPLILDGRSTTAAGMPSDYTGQYAYQYHRAQKFYSKFWDWDSSKWLSEINSCANTHTYGHDGYMAYLYDRYHDCLEREECKGKVTAARDALKQELGPREFTLTYSPDWYENDDAAQHAMKVAIDKLTRYYKDEIIEFHAVGEFTRAGRAHVHAWYHLDGGRKITDKNFKRAWSHWNPRKKIGDGFQGGHHATVKRLSDFSSYAEKHLEKAWMNVNITNASNDTSTQREGEEGELSPTSRNEDS